MHVRIILARENYSDILDILQYRFSVFKLRYNIHPKRYYE